MRFRWLDDVALPGTAALLEGLWLGAAVGVVAGVPPVAACAAAFVIVAAGAALALLARRGVNMLALRLALLAIVAAGAGALTLLVQPGGWPRMAAMFIGAAFGAAFVLWLGLRIGRARIRPEDAVWRGARCFALLCFVCAVAPAVGPASTVDGALPVAIVAVVLLIALARLKEIAGALDRRHGLTGVTWIAGVIAVAVAVLLLAASLALAGRGGVPAAVAAAGADLLGALFDGVRGVVLGVLGAVLRGLAWLIAGLHLRLPHVLHPLTDKQFHPKTPPPPRPQGAPLFRSARDVLSAFLLTLLVVGAAGAVVIMLVRSLRGGADDQPSEVVEERESVLSSGELVARVGARIAGLVPRALWGRRPGDPSEAVRREFVRLETASARLGRPRAPAATVRAFLIGQEPAPEDDALSLARLYEIARYSPHMLAWPDVETFRAARVRYVSALRSERDVSRRDGHGDPARSGS